MGIFSAWFLWFLVTVLFVALEFVTPGFIILFFGVGALITSIVTRFADIPISWQLLIFTVSSVLSLVLARNFCKELFRGRTDNQKNEYDESIAGKVGTVTEKITASQNGKIKFQGSFWAAVSDSEIEEGETVSVVGKDSSNSLTLVVKKTE